MRGADAVDKADVADRPRSGRIETAGQVKAAAEMLAGRIGDDVAARQKAMRRRQRADRNVAVVAGRVTRPAVLSLSPAEYARSVLGQAKGYIRTQVKAAGDSARAHIWRAVLELVESAEVEGEAGARDEGRGTREEKGAEFRAVERSRAGQKTVKVAP